MRVDCQDMVFSNFLFRPICHFTLAIRVASLATVSRLFPYSSRSLAIVPNVSQRLAIFSLFSPYASLFSYYPSYADYDYLISPFHSRCYLSLAPYVSLSFSSLCLFLRSHRRNKRKTNTIGAILMVQQATAGIPYKGLSQPGPMARDRSLSPSPGAKRIDDVVLNHQLTPSCTSSKLVALAASGIVLFLNH